MDAEEQIEKMARSICSGMGYNPDSDWVNEGGEELPLWRDYCVLAKSVLAQLAEANKRADEMSAAILEYHRAFFNQDQSAEANTRRTETRHAMFLHLHDGDL